MYNTQTFFQVDSTSVISLLDRSVQFSRSDVFSLTWEKNLGKLPSISARTHAN
jgi:hypothetical protein